MKEADIKRILREAAKIREKASTAKQPSTPCLSDEAMRSICERTLPESQRNSVIDHLYECDRCRKDLKLYFDLVESVEKRKALRKFDIRLFHNGKPVPQPQVHWLIFGRTFEMWDITQAGKYKLAVGSKSIEINCSHEDIIKGPKEARYRKTGATTDRAKLSKQVIAPDKSISVRVFAGRHAGRFHVTIQPKA